MGVGAGRQAPRGRTHESARTSCRTQAASRKPRAASVASARSRMCRGTTHDSGAAICRAASDCTDAPLAAAAASPCANAHHCATSNSVPCTTSSSTVAVLTSAGDRCPSSCAAYRCAREGKCCGGCAAAYDGAAHAHCGHDGGLSTLRSPVVRALHDRPPCAPHASTPPRAGRQRVPSHTATAAARPCSRTRGSGC